MEYALKSINIVSISGYQDTTMEDATAKLFSLGWTLRQSHLILTNYHGRYDGATANSLHLCVHEEHK